MSKFEKIIVVLLSIIALSSAILAFEMVCLVRSGFSIELTTEQAQELTENSELTQDGQEVTD